jgi:putative hydrolase of the HAD superfamily
MLKAVLFDLGDTLVEEGTVQLAPYTLDVLTALSDRFKLAIICNATTATTDIVQDVLQRAGIAAFFEVVVVSTDVGCRKPDVRIFKLTLDRLHVTADEAMMVGNRIATDVRGGNQMGIPTVLLRWKATYPEPMTDDLDVPTFTIQSLHEVLPIIENLTKEEVSSDE